MSKCKAPNCDLKPFSGCEESEFCNLGDPNVDQTNPTCTPKPGNERTSFSFEQDECAEGIDENSPTAQLECEGRKGCKWEYGTGSKLVKMCKDDSFDCNLTGDLDNDRFIMEDKETYGCNAVKCDYEPGTKEYEPGVCGITEICSLKTNKNSCLSVEGEECEWTPNDSAFCGYQRTIKEAMEDETTDWTTVETDPCAKIQNPSEEVCNAWGCVWDIYGDRKALEDVNYDYNSSGVCKLPSVTSCLNTYCLKNSKTDANRLWPDGKCKGEDGPVTCERTNKEIIPHKTPGLMKEGVHPDDKQVEIDNVEQLLENSDGSYGVKGSFTDTTNKDLENNKLLSKINTLYKDSCQKRGKYPSVSDPIQEFKTNEYDFNQSKCITQDESRDDLGSLCGNLSKGADTGFHTIHWPTYTGTDSSSNNVIDEPYSFTEGVCIGISNTSRDISTCNGLANEKACYLNSACTWHKYQRCTNNSPDGVTDMTEFNTGIDAIEQARGGVDNFDMIKDYYEDGSGGGGGSGLYAAGGATNLDLGNGNVDFTINLLGQTNYTTTVEADSELLKNDITDALDDHLTCRRHYYVVLDFLKDIISGFNTDADTDVVTVRDGFGGETGSKIPKNIEQAELLYHYIKRKTFMGDDPITDYELYIGGEFVSTGTLGHDGDGNSPNVYHSDRLELGDTTDYSSPDNHDIYITGKKGGADFYSTGLISSVEAAEQDSASQQIGATWKSCFPATLCDGNIDPAVNPVGTPATFGTRDTVPPTGGTYTIIKPWNVTTESFIIGEILKISNYFHQDLYQKEEYEYKLAELILNISQLASTKCSDANTSDCSPLTNTTLDAGAAANANPCTCSSGELKPACIFDHVRNIYSKHDTRIKNHIGFFQKITEEYPIKRAGVCKLAADSSFNAGCSVKSKDQCYGDTSCVWDEETESTDISVYIGNSDTEIQPNIEIEHSIKDITYTRGNAVLTMELHDDNGDPVDEPFFNSGAVKTALDTQFTGGNLTMISGDDSDKILKLEDAYYNVVPGSLKKYHNKLFDIEISNVDPGEITRHVYTTPLHINNIDISGNYKIIVKEINFKDIGMRIYFNGDINGLYKRNDIISLEYLVDNPAFEKNFNPRYTLDNTGTGTRYNKVTNVDYVENYIEVDNVSRGYSGKYFIGRFEHEGNKCTDGDTNNTVGPAAPTCKPVLTDEYVSGAFCFQAVGGSGSLAHTLAQGTQNVFKGIATTETNLSTALGSSLSDSNSLNIYVYNNADDLLLGIGTIDTGATISGDTTLDANDDGTSDQNLTINPITWRDGTPGWTNISNSTELTLNIVIGDDQRDMLSALVLDTDVAGNTTCKLNEDVIPGDLSTEPGADLTCEEVDRTLYFPKNRSSCAANDYETNIPASQEPQELTLVNEKYTINHTNLVALFGDPFSEIVDENIEGWIVTYLVDLAGGQKEEKSGTIDVYSYTAGTGNVAGNHTFKIKDGTATYESAAAITLLKLKGNIHGIDYHQDKVIEIKNYIRKEVQHFSNKEENITDPILCGLNNGIWNDFECKSHGEGQFRNLDICENTGFTWDSSNNTCTREFEEYTIDPANDTTYCGIKINANPPTEYNLPNVEDACPSCKFTQTASERKCEPKTEKDCLKKEDDDCGEESGCEYYKDVMDPYDDDGVSRDPLIEFECTGDPNSGSSDICRTKDTELECSEAKCEWQCPWVTGNTIDGYVVASSNNPDDPMVPDRTINNNTNKYYSPSDFSITCADGWNVEDGKSVRAECIPYEGGEGMENHTSRIELIGCEKQITCRDNTIMDGQPLTPTYLNGLSIDDVPSIFITGEGDNRVIDPTKLPDDNGNFVCPLPQSLRSTNEEGWDAEKCCHNVGLCKDNDDNTVDVNCGPDQVHKLTYYTGSDVLQPMVGRTPEACCEAPTEPTITVPLDADYATLAGDEGSITREEFELNFKNDIVDLLNASPNVDVTVTAEMITILYVGEGSVVVTFKIYKDAEGKTVLPEQISKTIQAGTQFQRLNTVANAIPNFKKFDPKSKFLYYSDYYKRGITHEEAAISIIGFFFVCFLCLVTIGMVFK